MKKIFRVDPHTGGRQIVVTLTDDSATVNDWIKEFANWDVCFGGHSRIMLGFDVEWKPNKRPGEDNSIALLQIANSQHCLIVQMLYLDSMPSELLELLESPDVPLAGVGIEDDGKKMEQQYGIVCDGLVDLRNVAANFYKNERCKRASLQDLSHQILGEPLKKPTSIVMSDWSRRFLSVDQVQYAALDAWTSFSVFNELATLSTKLHPVTA